MLSLTAIDIPTHETVGELRLLDYLSQSERSHYNKTRNHKLRRRWISGRLAAKHLLLTEMGSVAASRIRPRLAWIDLAAMEEFPTWAYREIEILHPQAQKGFPLVSWAGRAHPSHVSLSYTPQFAVACLDPMQLVGVDVDIPSRRNPAFYRVNFSSRERSWAEEISRAAAVDADWPYSILWCLKESVLKAKASPQASLWRLPRIGVQPRFVLEKLIASLQLRSEQGPLLLGEVEVSEDGRSQIGEVTLAVTGNAVLTALRLQP